MSQVGVAVLRKVEKIENENRRGKKGMLKLMLSTVGCGSILGRTRQRNGR